MILISDELTERKLWHVKLPQFEPFLKKSEKTSNILNLSM